VIHLKIQQNVLGFFGRFGKNLKLKYFLKKKSSNILGQNFLVKFLSSNIFGQISFVKFFWSKFFRQFPAKFQPKLC